MSIKSPLFFFFLSAKQEKEKKRRREEDKPPLEARVVLDLDREGSDSVGASSNVKVDDLGEGLEGTDGSPDGGGGDVTERASGREFERVGLIDAELEVLVAGLDGDGDALEDGRLVGGQRTGLEGEDETSGQVARDGLLEDLRVGVGGDGEGLGVEVSDADHLADGGGVRPHLGGLDVLTHKQTAECHCNGHSH